MTERTQHSLSKHIKNMLRLVSMKCSIIILSLLAALFSLAPAVASSKSTQGITVVSSIKPVQLITSAVIGNLGESKILLPPSANPHNYQLRPSQRSLLSDADLFVWVGPELELFLVKVLNTSSVTQISLTEALQLNKSQPNEPPITHDGHSYDDHSYESHGNHSPDEHQHSPDEHQHSPDEHQHSPDKHQHSVADHKGSFDPHIWLNPALTENIASAIYQQLSSQYPELEPQFKLNLSQFVTGLHATEQEITELFNTKNQIAIYTFHEAFSHFADHYGLNIAGTITKTPETRPGAKHLSELAEEIRQNKKICLVKEPNFKAPYVDSITRGTEVIITTADPLATDVSNSINGYFEFIRSIADSFKKCLP